MPNTPELGFPYPASTDLVADGYANIENLAEAVEDALVGENYVGRYRNLLYNGDMRIAQRNTNVSGISTGGYYTADRWVTVASAIFGSWTQQQATDANLQQYGFSSYLYNRCTGAQSPGFYNVYAISQRLEGQDLQHLRKGTPEARPLTLSFYVYTNVTGTYVASLYDSTNDRIVSQSYSIPTANVWTRVEVTFPPDTTGTLANSNARALSVELWMFAGNGYQSAPLQTTWAPYASGFAGWATGQVNVAASTANYWSVTGVQLEVGEHATPFEHRPYGEEFARCQRYYESVYAGPVITSHPVANASIGTNGFREALVYIKFATAKRSSSYTMTGYRSDTAAANLWLVNISGSNLALAPTFAPKTPQGCRAYVGSGSLPAFGVAELYYNWTCSDEL